MTSPLKARHPNVSTGDILGEQDTQGVPGAYRWDVTGTATVNGVQRTGTYELVVDPVKKLVLHFNFIPND
jgi:hypothetical protein